MKDVRKIDIHAHVTVYPDIVPKLQITGQRFLSVEEQIAIYDKLNIETGVLLPIVSPEGMWFTMSNENCYLAAKEKPERFLWFCNVDPRSCINDKNADLSYLIEHYKALGARGVGELTSNMYADDPKMENLFSHCVRCDMPVLIHVSPSPGVNYGIVDELGLPRIERELKKFPDLKLIGHSQPFWAEMSSDVTEALRNDYPTGKVKEGRLPKLMREYGNLYCDISAGSGANALMRDKEYAARFLEEFADRVLYGCDFCAVTNEHQFELDKFLDGMVKDGYLSMENYKKIVRENAIKLLKL
ncbi:MAG: amidohydrolase family protein [Clostridia bacterium]|nr:amidohydrolase family protein [Clostridia bacterium]